jgi:hypothetical protein
MAYRAIGNAESDRDGVHRQDTLPVRCKRVHVTFPDAAGRHQTELTLAGSGAEVLKRASKHPEFSTKGS